VGADQIKSDAEASKQKPLSPFGSVAQVQPIENTAGKSDGTKKGKRVDDRSEVIDNGDGTKTVRIAVSPQSSDGKAAKLKPVGGRFQAEGTLQPISVASSSGDPDLATLGSPGRQLRIGRPTVAGVVDTVQATPPGNAKNGSSERKISDRGVNPGEGKAIESAIVPAVLETSSADTAGFKGVFGTGTDLSYQVLPDGLKESVVLATRPTGKDPLVFRFPINTDGVTARASKSGGYEFTDAAGKIAFQIPASFAFDSRGGKDTPGNAYSDVTTELRTGPEGTTLVVSPSMEWLRDAARVYPVVIDPTVTLQPWNPMNLGYMPWGNNAGSTTFSAWTNDMMFGNWWGSQWNSYIQFDPSLFAGRTINSATLNMRVDYCGNQTNSAAPYANPIHVHQLTSGYYFGQAWPGPSFTGDVTTMPGGYGSTSSVNITSWAAQWAANPSSNFGVMLDMGTAAGYCRVQRTASTGQQTYVEVTYNDIPSNVQEYGILKNFSFETGRSAWQPCYRAEQAIWDVVTGTTPSGLKLSKLRSQDAVGGVSLCQTVVLPVGPGKTYNLIASVHSPTGAAVSGRLLLAETGNNPAEAHKDFTISGNYWSNIQVQMAGQNANNFGLRAEIVVSSPYTTDLDIDYLVLTGLNADGSPMVATGSTTGTPPPPTTPPTTTVVPATTTPPTTVPVTSPPATVPGVVPTVPPAPPTTLPPAPPTPVFPDPWDAYSTKRIVNTQSSRCIFPRDYNMSPGVSVVAAPCSGDGAEAWQFARPNGLLQIRTFYNSPVYSQQLCLDIDNFNPATGQNEASPANGARAQIYFCTGGSNQQFLTSQQPQNGMWQLQPQTAGNPTNQQKCLDEDVNFQNGTSYPSWLVQHYDCNAGTNQHWNPIAYGTITAGPGSPGPVEGSPFEDSIPTLIETPERSLCLASGSWTLANSSACTSFTPVLAPGGYKITQTANNGLCLDSNGTSIYFAGCGSAKSWSDLDPFGRGIYPDQYFRFPIWYRDGNGIPQCLSRAGVWSGISTSIAPCSSYSDAQLWTDGFKFSTSGSVFGFEKAHNYAPSQVGDRVFWCAGLGTDVIVNWKVGGPTANMQKPAYTARLAPTTGLVCDPHPVKTAGGYRVFVTRGNPDRGGGTNGNGIGYYDFDNNGKRIGAAAEPTMIIGITPPGTYGNGQPSVTPDPSGGYLMAYRGDGPVQPGSIILRSLDASFGLGASPRFAAADETVAANEVASQPDIFIRNGKLYNLVTGNGYAGIRTYTKRTNGNFTRDTGELNTGNLPAQTYLNLGSSNDGAGIQRGVNNEPVVTDSSVNLLWGAAADANGFNKLRRGSAIKIP
jgi:hypothetical protein